MQPSRYPTSVTDVMFGFQRIEWRRCTAGIIIVSNKNVHSTYFILSVNAHAIHHEYQLVTYLNMRTILLRRHA